MDGLAGLAGVDDQSLDAPGGPRALQGTDDPFAEERSDMGVRDHDDVRDPLAATEMLGKPVEEPFADLNVIAPLLERNVNSRSRQGEDLSASEGSWRAGADKIRRRLNEVAERPLA